MTGGEFDLAAFRALFHEQRDAVFRCLHRLTRNASDAEDLLQETFLTVWRKRASFDGRGISPPYLRQIAFNLYLSSRERTVHRVASNADVEELIGDAAADDQAGERGEELAFLARRIRQAIDELPPQARDAFILFRYEGLTCAEVALVTQAPLKTVETRLARATELLARKLEPYRHHLANL